MTLFLFYFNAKCNDFFSVEMMWKHVLPCVRLATRLARCMLIVDFICMDLLVLELQGAQTENYKMKSSCQQRDSNSRPLNRKATVVTVGYRI